MGQRAFRGRLTDSLIKNYLNKDSEYSQAADYSTNTGTINKSEDQYFQGRKVDLNLEFSIDFPLNDINDINVALSKGVINAVIPNGTKIKNLNLSISSKYFGTGKVQIHSNLYILFGSHFHRDISSIKIRLYNPMTKKTSNDRKTISNILDFMCFKTIKCVIINNSLLYYIIPEYSKFAIVLAYKDINFYEEKEFNFQTCLEDLLFHSYCTFERTNENYLRCLNAIEKTVPKEVSNIILPIIYFNDISIEDLLNSDDQTNYTDFTDFINEIYSRFKIMSIEIKLMFKEENSKKDQNLFLQACKTFVNKIILENVLLLKKFTYCYLSFDFLNLEKNADTNSELSSEFRNILLRHRFENLTLANHINYTVRNTITNLDDNFDFYDYIYFDKSYSNKISSLLCLLKKQKTLNKVYKRKPILANVLRSSFDLKKNYCEGRLNFSTEFIKNKKIVPFEVQGNNFMVLTN